MVRSKNVMKNKVKEIESLEDIKEHPYLEGLIDGINWSLQKLLTLNLEAFK